MEGHRVGPAGVLDDELVLPVLRRRDLNRTLRSGRVVLSDFRAGGVVDEKVHVGILQAVRGGLELFGTAGRATNESGDLAVLVSNDVVHEEKLFVTGRQFADRAHEVQPVGLLAGNLEADVTETLSRDDGLLTFAADDDCSEFHRSPPQLCLLFLVGEIFFLHGTCSLLLPARSLLAEAKTSSKRCPRNFSSSSPERNRSSVPESTSSTQPSN